MKQEKMAPDYKILTQIRWLVFYGISNLMDYLMPNRVCICRNAVGVFQNVQSFLQIRGDSSDRSN